MGLITFRKPGPVSVVRLLPKSAKLQEREPVFSCGCDRGADPTRRDTQITKLNRYLGPTNIEIAGAPVQGRSGGGLFDVQGRLIGVCFAADNELDEGRLGPDVGWMLNWSVLVSSGSMMGLNLHRQYRTRITPVTASLWSQGQAKSQPCQPDRRRRVPSQPLNSFLPRASSVRAYKVREQQQRPDQK